MGKPKVPKEQRQAMAAQAEQMKRLGEIDLPELQELVLQNPELVGLLEAQELGPSAMEDIATDLRLKDTQMQALQAIKDRAESGMTSEDKLAMEQMLTQTDAAASAREKGMMQDMARRGTLDSGAQLAAMLQGQQSDASNARQKAMQMAAQSSANRAQAAQQMGAMAGQMESADYGRQANLASARDRIAQANAAARGQTQQQNLAARQAIANQKAALQNQQTMYNIGRDQQQFQNQLAKAGAQGSATNAYSNMAASMPQKGSTGQMLGTLAGAAIGAKFGGIKGAQAGATIGGAGGGLLGFEDGGVVHAENGMGGYDSMSFADAHKAARQMQGGAGGTFKWNNKLYNTNIKGENNPVDMSVIDESGGIQDSPVSDEQFMYNANKRKLAEQGIEDLSGPIGGPKMTDEEFMKQDSIKEYNQEAIDAAEKRNADELGAIAGIAKQLNKKPEKKPQLNLNTNVQYSAPQNILGKNMQPQQFSNTWAAEDGGTYYAEDGDLMYVSDGQGDIVEGDDFERDRVDAKLNSGEMVLNVTQQQRLMDLLRGKADIKDLGDKDIVEGVPRDYQEKVLKAEDGGVAMLDKLAMAEPAYLEGEDIEEPNAYEGRQKEEEEKEKAEDMLYSYDTQNEDFDVSKPKDLDPMSEYKKLLDKYNKRSTEKADNSTMKGWGAVADIMDRAASNYNPFYRSAKSDMVSDIEKEEKSSRKQDLGDITTMMGLLEKYQKMNAPKSAKGKDMKNVFKVGDDLVKVTEKGAEKLYGADKKDVSDFTKEQRKQQAKSYAKSQDSLKGIANSIDKVDDALQAQLNYSKDEVLGTGPLATLGGLTKYVSADTEALDAKFKEIDLKNMVSTFSGMSKAVDSDAERRAWKATQASVSNDDSTNVQILLGSKSSLLKDKIVSEAMRDHVKQYGNLDDFTHPVLEGKTTTMVDSKGEMRVVDKKKAEELKKLGMMNLDEYASSLLGESEYVTMVSPNGEERKVKADKVKKYQKMGAKIKR